MKLILLSFIFFCHISFYKAQSSPTLIKAHKEMRNHNYSVAITLFTNVIQSNNLQDKPSAYFGRGNCYYELQEYKRAKKDLKKSIKIIKDDNPNYTDIKSSAYWVYSLIISNKKTTQKSLSLLKKSSELKPSSLLFSTIGFDEIYLGKLDDALKSLNKSISLDSNNAWAYSNRALAYLKLEKLDLARKDIIKSMSMDAENPFVFKHSALIYLAKGEFEAACIDLHQASRLVLSERMADNTISEIEELIEKHCKTID